MIRFTLKLYRAAVDLCDVKTKEGGKNQCYQFRIDKRIVFSIEIVHTGTSVYFGTFSD